MMKSVPSPAMELSELVVRPLMSAPPGTPRWYLGVPGGALISGLTTNSLNSMAGDGTDFIIGNETDTTHGFAGGAVDEFATWTRQLSAAEITNQFNNIPATLLPPRSTYEGVVSAQSPSYYFKLD